MADNPWTTQIRRMGISEEILAERDRQDERFGEQWEMPLGADVSDRFSYLTKACTYKSINGSSAKDFASMLLEEVYEALAESDPQKMREELIQVLAVAMKMVEKIDREAGS